MLAGGVASTCICTIINPYASSVSGTLFHNNMEFVLVLGAGVLSTNVNHAGISALIFIVVGTFPLNESDSF